MIGLDDLVAGASPASRDEAVSLMGLVAAAQIRLAKIVADLAVASAEDRLLDVAEAAEKLGVDRAWLYRRTRSLPFVVHLDGAVRFSARGVDQFIAARRGR
jgi:predicted DNA-binding transcriptional regulator AlpA